MAKESKTATAMENLLGPNLLTKVGQTKPTKTVLESSDLVALYFSASWCPPCKAFTPSLASFYKKCAKPNKVEIIFVSSDQNMNDFNTYFTAMPWTALPADTAEIKQNLADSLKIKGIPALVILDSKTGHFITDNAKDEVFSVGEDEEKGKALVASWKERKPVPLELAKFGGGKSRFSLGSILLYFARNPAFIFGTIYIVKRFMKWLDELGKDEEGEL